MAVKILMPALSPTMTEGNLAKWHVKEGDHVGPGDVIAEIETDKATMEVEAVDEGTLGRIVIAEGTEGVKVNATIGLLLEDGEDDSALDSMDSPAGSAKAPDSASADGMAAAAEAAATSGEVSATPLARRIAQQTNLDLAVVPGTGDRGRILKADVEAALSAREETSAPAAAVAPPGTEAAGKRIFASPVARRMATEAGLELSAIQGSGPGDRIVKRDVEAAAAAAAAAPALIAVDGDSWELVSLSAIRKVIARRMTESKTQVPHFYLTVECEIDELLKVRKSLNSMPGEAGLSINDFIVRACALALRDVPAANVAYENENEMRRFRSADIAVAVALSEGLVTPVVRAAETKGLKEISAEMKDLAARARDGKLLPEEYQGGSFTISNLGMYGIRQFDAVINPPQACILAVGAGEQRPVVRNGDIVAATVMCCTLSVDHRLVDGAIASELISAIKRYIEYPPAMLL